MFYYGIAFSNFKELLFNIQKTDEKLERFKKGLTLKKVLMEYLSHLVLIAIEELEVSDEIKKSRYSNDFNEANIRYCFVCPQSLRDFVTECFVEAEIIQEHEVHERISFVTEVEAVAYSLLSLDSRLNELTPNQSYLICNVSELAFGIAEINVDTTESLSTVELLYENSDYGWTVLQTTFRNYLKANSIKLNLNNSIIEDLVIDFTSQFKKNALYNQLRVQQKFFPDHDDSNKKNHQTNAFIHFLDANETPITISFSDLNEFVYLPFMKHLTQRIMGSFRRLENRKLILSGKYCCDPYFIEYLIYDSSKTLLEHASIICDGHIKESFGAVSAAMRINEFQIPISFDTAVDETENDSIHDTENTNQNFDFVIGIDFGSAFTGCSYMDLRNGKNIIKTIKAHEWPGAKLNISDKIPTRLSPHDITQEFNTWRRKTNFRGVNDENRVIHNFLNGMVMYCSTSTTEEMAPGVHFLMHLNDHVKKVVIENETKGKMKIENPRFRYIITVPEWWGDSYRNHLVEAAIKSQIIGENEMNHLTLITEPDAAILS
ncbi:hypothetical protein INT47_013185 [Mucor saturninus]|uniref:Uncharacterized protein n=1 Tax=Mucor saturninus TaxID=64648 RepID=A0A8H7UTP0_9FUNG|nr:hypothetical protein INT47_013185 [Mucor saturninus]